MCMSTFLSKSIQKTTYYIDDDDQVLDHQITKSSFWHRHQRIRVQMHPTTAHGLFPESKNRILIRHAIFLEDTLLVEHNTRMRF